ncbi:MAG: helix-turn-helix, AraC type [uncultured bacterium]|nr:MAG: helix-turn-helix, AraC type [uncultured bacterium]
MKKNILFLQPLYYEPELPNFKDRFTFLSNEGLGGLILSASEKGFIKLNFGNFKYQSISYFKNRFVRLLFHVFLIFYFSIKYSLKNKVDYIHCYDPLFFGPLGVILKFLFSAKLIVEVNGFLLKDSEIENRKSNILKKMLYNITTSFSFYFSDALKFLNIFQQKEILNDEHKKNIFIFHDFVPTSYFQNGKTNNNLNPDTILSLGYPFHRKGMDILIKAFNIISPKYPNIKLKIVGHCPGGDSERNHYINMCVNKDKIEILKGVRYNEIINLFNDSILFVLASRSEGMGRVLIESMTCGVPVIGSNVGGIPYVIDDKKNGFLFESEDYNELAEKIDVFLSNPQIQINMHKQCLNTINEKFSDKKYVKAFIEMLNNI